MPETLFGAPTEYVALAGLGVALLFGRELRALWDALTAGDDASPLAGITPKATAAATTPAGTPDVAWSEAVTSCRRLQGYFADERDGPARKALDDVVWPAIGRRA